MSTSTINNHLGSNYPCVTVTPRQQLPLCHGNCVYHTLLLQISLCLGVTPSIHCCKSLRPFRCSVCLRSLRQNLFRRATLWSFKLATLHPSQPAALQFMCLLQFCLNVNACLTLGDFPFSETRMIFRNCYDEYSMQVSGPNLDQA